MKRNLLAVAVVCLVVCVFCQEVILQQLSPFRGDIPLQFYPWKSYIRSMLAQGELPYWNPYTYGGAPLLANMQSAVFYPLDLILFVFPQEWFFGLSLLLHLLLAGVGAYFLALKCGASPLTALLAGIAYSLNGFTMIHIPAGNHLTYAGAAWAPWMFYTAAGFVFAEIKRLRWLLGAALVTLLHFLCGHPQMTFYSLFFSSVFCFALCIWKTRGLEPRSWAGPAFRTLFFMLFLAFGVLIAGMQLLPTLEYLQQANRAAALDIQMATEFSFAPHRLITLFLPDFYGSKGFMRGDNHYDAFYYWSNAYAGFIVPLLAIYALRKKNRPASVIPLALVGLLGLFFAWGRGNPFYEYIILSLPGFGHFRAPAKFLPYYLVPVCTLAALGLERLSADAYDRQALSGFKGSHTAAHVGLIGALVLIVTLGSLALPEVYDKLRHLDVPARISQIRLYSFQIGGLLMLCAIVLYQFASRATKPRLAFSIAFTLLLVLDLFSFGRGYLQASLWEPERIARVAAPPPEIRTLLEKESIPPYERTAMTGELGFPNYLILWKVSNIAGYDPMSLKSYNQFVGEMEGWKKGEFIDNIQLRQTNHPHLDALNVKYILTRNELDGKAFQKRGGGSLFNVFERTGSQRSWAFAAPEGVEDATGWIPVQGGFAMKTYEPHRIEFAYATTEPTQLRVSEWYYPGWQSEATLNNGETKKMEIRPSPEGFRLLSLPKDTQEVAMIYRPSYTGWAVSFIAIIICAGFALLDYLYQTERLYGIVSRLMGRYY